jgi:phosphoglucomutase/phosphomannomutase
MDYIERYRAWLNAEWISEEDRKELKSIENNDNEIKERFYDELKFGTAGLRGILGVGSNRMNVYNVRRATQALANHISKFGDNAKSRGVVISFDTRYKSKEFAREAAAVLSANGIKVYLFPDYRPTPELSFSVLKFNCMAGIMITASHNPPQYNGYKVYWENAAQIIAPHDKEIIHEYLNVDLSTVNLKYDDYIEIDVNDVDNDFINAVLHQRINDVDFTKVNVVYTALNGTGIKIMKPLAEKLGLNINYVEEQIIPDPEFSTLRLPNPEEDDAFEYSIKLGKKVNADILTASDPDADRVGIMAKPSFDSEDYVKLNGNQVGILLTHYILKYKKLPKNPLIVKTIVTSELVAKIARSFNVDIVNTLTGFKWMGNLIWDLNKEGKKNFVYGFEESYGYLVGQHARDKDSFAAIMLMIEMAAFYKAKGKTLFDAIEDIYKEYGYYLEYTWSLVIEGIDGNEKRDKIMNYLRKNPPKVLCSEELTEFIDYINGRGNIPPSNVLSFQYGEKMKVSARPSGTEPKVKFYFMVMNMEERNEAEKLLNSMVKEFKKIVEEAK